MIKNGTIVEVYEDPLTMKRKEGNARIVKFLYEDEPGFGCYLVHFIGDAPEFFVQRFVADKPTCTCCDSLHAGDDVNCPVRGKAVVNVAAN
ncbi:MAG: hypothetical protein C4583_04955 [Anaerolineaceae bacterium]|nr:MAG: hypothetical protein C4583_04955 [Anaerolineaceae bacterium]